MIVINAADTDLRDQCCDCTGRTEVLGIIGILIWVKCTQCGMEQAA